jgi:hypothetical protein
MYNYSLIVRSVYHTGFGGGAHKCERLFSSSVMKSVKTLHTSGTLQRKYCKTSFIQGARGQI